MSIDMGLVREMLGREDNVLAIEANVGKGEEDLEGGATDKDEGNIEDKKGGGALGAADVSSLAGGAGG